MLFFGHHQATGFELHIITAPALFPQPSHSGSSLIKSGSYLPLGVVLSIPAQSNN
jgi:hypothetical protein